MSARTKVYRISSTSGEELTIHEVSVTKTTPKRVYVTRSLSTRLSSTLVLDPHPDVSESVNREWAWTQRAAAVLFIGGIVGKIHEAELELARARAAYDSALRLATS